MPYAEISKIRDALYEADAITFRGLSILNNFPAADVVEVKHGEWQEVTQKNITLILCSICGRRIPRGIYNIEFYSDYCPHCGAKMDGGNHE